MRIQAWVAQATGQALVQTERDASPGPGQVLVEVAGCGICHTDLGYLYDGVPTRHGFPLVLGHEISGTVIGGGDGTREWLGREVVVPAVMPCGACRACGDGRGSICSKQIFPGNDIDGGFATHVVVPARGLCLVPDLCSASSNPAGLDLADLSVVADAVSTPYQAIHRSGLGAGEMAVFVGAGGVGGFGIQIAAALGALAVAIDVRDDRLEMMSHHGAALTLNSKSFEPKELRRQLRAFAGDHGVPSYGLKIFETSGTAAGQSLAFSLLGHGGWLGVVGYTSESVSVKLSNLMALDAVAQGNWGCLPEHYPAVVGLALSGKVSLRPFIERRPFSAINECLRDLREGRAMRRVVLLPV